MTGAIAPDHLSLLSLARAAFRARDNKALWSKDFEEACEQHGAACDALWDELTRQIALFDGLVPAAEPPEIKRRKVISQMRREVADILKNAISEAFDELDKSPLIDALA